MHDAILIGSAIGLALIGFAVCEFFASYFPGDDEAPR